MDRKLKLILRKIRADVKSGASEIALTAARDVETLMCKYKLEIRPSEAREFALGLVKSQPNMAPLWNFANDILLSDLEGSSICAICRRTVTHHLAAAKAVGVKASQLLGDGLVATNSSSDAVFETLVAASKRLHVGVLLTESRPGREGLNLARWLGKAGLDVTVFSDASLSRALSRADFALVGADAITKLGVVGKVGIMNLALSARESEIDSIVCADSSKFAPIKIVDVSRPAREISSRIHPRVHIENVYFEEVAHDKFSWIVTESGALRPGSAKRLVTRIKIALALASRRPRCSS